MPVNNYTIGKDVSLVIQTENGPLTLPGLTDFSADPVVVDIKSKPMTTGIPIHAYIPDGWRLSFKVDRTDPTIDSYWATFEAAYFAGGNQQSSGTILETIQEVDSVSVWRYTNVVIKLDKSGDKGADKKVEMNLSGMASQRIRVS